MGTGINPAANPARGLKCKCGPPICSEADDGALGFVGDGRGSYIRETSYQYVGTGAGELDYTQPAPTPNNFICIAGVSVVALLIPLLLWLFFGSGFTATTTAGPYDCDAGLSNSQMGWSAGKRAYCCNNFQKGCLAMAPATFPPTQPPTAPPAPPHGIASFDCNAGFSRWMSGWSPSKKVYCCTHEQKGCPIVASAPAPLSVPVPVPVPVPAPAPLPVVTTSSCPYDCNAGFDEWPLQWVKGWGGGKKIYCCKVAQKGCPSDLPEPSGIPASGIPAAVDEGPYDCNAGYHPCYSCLLKHWSANKLAWCCREKHMGCKADTPANM